jgi:uncharacterized protein
MADPEERISIAVPERGPVSGVYARPRGADATLVVAHGAGAGMDHPFMSGFTRAVNELGMATLRFNFLYVEAGKRAPDRAPVAIETWRAAFDAAAGRAKTGEPVWAGGKSFGGRMASMAVAEGMPASGLIFLGYPLHAPGKPDAPRAAHLAEIDVPMLFLQGTRDPFANKEVLQPVLKGLGDRATYRPIQDGGHSFETPGAKKDPRATAAALAPAVVDFIRAHEG